MCMQHLCETAKHSQLQGVEGSRHVITEMPRLAPAGADEVILLGQHCTNWMTTRLAVQHQTQDKQGQPAALCHARVMIKTTPAAPTHPQDLVAVAHTIQSNGVGSLLDCAELHKGKALVVVDVARYHWVPSSACTTNARTPELCRCCTLALHRHHNTACRDGAGKALHNQLLMQAGKLCRIWPTAQRERPASRGVSWCSTGSGMWACKASLFADGLGQE